MSYIDPLGLETGMKADNIVMFKLLLLDLAAGDVTAAAA